MLRAHDLMNERDIKGVPRALGTALLASVALACWISPASAQHGEEAENARLVGMHNLQARSAYHGVIQEQGGRWIAYIGHHVGVQRNPLNGLVEQNGTSIVDVTNPRNLVYLHHIPGVSGAQMAQTCSGDELPNGTPGEFYLLRANGNLSHELWDVTDPQVPVLLHTLVDDLAGTHKNWWECETGIAYLVADLRPEGWTTNRGLKVFDLSDPAQPEFIRNFGMVGSEPGATEPPVRNPGIHEPTVFLEKDRVFLAYGTFDTGAMQIVDRTALLEGDPTPTPENLLAPVISQLNMPDYWGGHTAWAMYDVVLPEYELFEEGSPRDFVILTSEATGSFCPNPMHHMTFMVDITDEAHPFPVANYQVPESEGLFCDRGGAFGTHSQNWSYTDVFYKKIVVYSYRNAGARMVDVRDPYHPKEVGFYIPATTDDTDERCAEIDGLEQCFVVIDTNNVEVDERGLVYLFDRANTGLHIVQLTGEARQLIETPAEGEEPDEDGEMVADLF